MVATRVGMEPDNNAKSDVQGEGNYDATHRYNEGLKQSVKKGDAEELAKKAKKALEGPEGEELRQAEKAGKAGDPKPARK